VFLKERHKGGEDEEEDVSSYWKTLRKQGHTGNINRKYLISFFLNTWFRAL